MRCKSQSPPQAHRMTHLLCGSCPSAASVPLGACCAAMPRGYRAPWLLCCVGTTQPESPSVQSCAAGRDCQGKPMVPAVPCSPPCCLLAKFSSSSADHFLFILLTFVQKNNLCLLQREGHLQRSCRYSLAPGAALGADRVLNRVEHPLCIPYE